MNHYYFFRSHQPAIAMFMIIILKPLKYIAVQLLAAGVFKKPFFFYLISRVRGHEGGNF